MIIRRLVVPLCLLGLLVPAAAAEAAPPKSAQRFADAGLRLTIAVKALKPQFKAGYEALDFKRCGRALMRDVPERQVERAATIVGIAAVQPLVTLSLPPMQQMVRDLDAIPTSDIALRRGRAAWRKSAALFAALPRLDDPCAQLEAWADAKWREAAAPKVTVADFERFTQAGASLERKFKGAVKRLRTLGISRGAAERFTGEKVFNDVIDDSFFDDALLDIGAPGGSDETAPAKPVRD